MRVLSRIVKRSFVLLLAFVMLLPATAFAWTVPQSALEYAEETAMPFFKACMKNPDDSWLGVYSEEEIDAMTLGQGLPVFAYDENSPDTIKEIVDGGAASWCFSLDTKDGPAALFEVRTDADGEMYHSGPELADNLNEAMAVMERLAQKEGIEEEPVLLTPRLAGYALCLSFNGDTRVITVPTSGMGSLDKAYSELTDYRMLPTLAELKAACREKAEYYAAHPGEYGSGAITLLPHAEPVDSDSPEKGPAKMTLLPFIIGLIVVAMAAAAVLVFSKRRAGQKA